MSGPAPPCHDTVPCNRTRATRASDVAIRPLSGRPAKPRPATLPGRGRASAPAGRLRRRPVVGQLEHFLDVKPAEDAALLRPPVAQADAAPAHRQLTPSRFALSTSSSSTSATPTTHHGQSNFARVRKMRWRCPTTGTVNCAVFDDLFECLKPYRLTS